MVQFFRLYSKRLPADLFDRLRFIIQVEGFKHAIILNFMVSVVSGQLTTFQVQDWDFVSHTCWLKHGIALLFDCLHLQDPIALAYNSGE